MLYLKDYLLCVLRGFGQLLFMPHAGTGVVALMGIILNSPLMALAALCGGGASTLVGFALNQRSAVQQGLFGFNGVLLGLAGVLFLEPGLSFWLLIAVAGGVTSLLFVLGLKRGLPLLTSPYILMFTLLYLYLPVRAVPDGGVQLIWLEQSLFSGAVTGVGQMGFQGNLLSALFMAVGLVLGGGARALCWATLGSTFGALAGYLSNAEDVALATGLFSYNTALIAVALGCTPGHSHTAWQPWAGMLLATALTTLGLHLLSIPVLTAPFVLAMWLVMLVQYLSHRKRIVTTC